MKGETRVFGSQAEGHFLPSGMRLTEFAVKATPDEVFETVQKMMLKGKYRDIMELFALSIAIARKLQEMDERLKDLRQELEAEVNDMRMELGMEVD